MRPIRMYKNNQERTNLKHQEINEEQQNEQTTSNQGFTRSDNSGKINIERISSSRNQITDGKTVSSYSKIETNRSSQDSVQHGGSSITYTSDTTGNPRITNARTNNDETHATGPIEDLNSTSHGREPEIESFADRAELAMMIQGMTVGALTVQPMRSIRSTFANLANVLIFHDVFTTEDKPSAFIEYHSDEMIVNMPKQTYNPIDNLAKILYLPSLEKFKYGTGIVQLNYSPHISKLYQNTNNIINTITDGITYANRTEFFIRVMVLMMMDRKILTMEFYDVDTSAISNTAILPTIPTTTGVSPLLRIDTRTEPIWYNDAIKTLITNLTIQYGKIKTVLDANAVKRYSVVGYPIDQYRAYLYNHNLLEYLGKKVKREDIMSLIKALSYEFDLITISDLEYQNIPKWFSDNDLSRFIFSICMFPDIVRQFHALNIDYFSQANVFTVKSENAIVKMLNSNQNMEPTIINWFLFRICAIDKTVIDDYFSLEMTPIIMRPKLYDFDMKRGEPVSLLYILELILFSIMFPNVTQHMLGQIQARILYISMYAFRQEYLKFITKFGFYYKIVNGRKEYIQVTNQNERMTENNDVLTGNLYPSLFTDDPTLSAIAPTLAKIARLMKPTTSLTPDDRAIAAKFPRFKDSAHLNPYSSLNIGGRTQHSVTYTRMYDAIEEMFNLILRAFASSFAQRPRAGVTQLKSLLTQLADPLCLALDGHVYHLYNVMANMMQNFIPNTDGQFHSFRACSYAVKDGGNIYRVVQNGDELNESLLIDTAIVWGLLGNTDSSYGNAIGATGTANVPTKVQPVIPTPDNFITPTIHLKTSIDAICSVEGILLLILSRQTTIPGYEDELNKLRTGISQPKVTERQYRRARESIKNMLGSGDYNVAPLHFLLHTEHRSTKLSKPLIRRVLDNVVQPYVANLDPAEFENTPQLIENSNMTRLQIALKMLTGDMDDIVKGLILHKRACAKFDVYETLTIPTDVKTIVLTMQHISTQTQNNMVYYVFLIDGVKILAEDIKNVNFQIDITGIWPEYVITLLLRAINNGFNTYVSMPNILYKPTITADVRQFMNTTKAETLLISNKSIVHEIMFFDNALQPKMSSDTLALSEAVYRTIWNSSIITQRISARGLMNLEDARPPEAKISHQSELDMGKIDETSGEPIYTSGLQKMQSSKVSMANVVLSAGSDVIRQAAIKYNVVRTQEIILFE
ncbi:major capsid protein [Fako virus]|uniref:Major capsid protein n=1 Tax=Fako virus TaxID=1567404 RepID=A0A0A0U7Z7_9REOV|nr:major capsid protein [Fako virus]6DJY_B Chain B, Major capsid protein [Fako virus]6DJY_C Chain C, Major capsid protein [Fako virus]AIW39864.1 major capsid protein [Fako virus]AIW39865.1 major capsid protein [Fako virus]AIW39866.1 major capsid protein [Fako virus]AIW39867.1 major capsid protein [Fako virus]